ncbi:hypothetical protein AB0469_39840 [Streptomyces sp. NPDC093801]|uniref:hypothetical protein n=1 Tax=Streptomyces sp. NPDC093801 TaxID=3155203 RepID=UPI003450BEB6
MVGVGELHQQPVRAAAAVLEMDLLQALDGNPLQPLLGDPGLLGGRQPARVARGQTGEHG